MIVEHKNAGKLKIVFIKTKEKLIPIVSTDLTLNDDEIIEIYKRRWDIEQGYKELREHFGFGKEENRIYEALKMIEEAKKRDHRKLGDELDLFMFDEPVRGLEILKSDMWHTSGYYACYGENMYFTEIDEQEYGIKPMNCIGHIQIFKKTSKSYRDLPHKMLEHSMVLRLM